MMGFAFVCAISDRKRSASVPLHGRVRLAGRHAKVVPAPAGPASGLRPVRATPNVGSALPRGDRVYLAVAMTSAWPIPVLMYHRLGPAPQASTVKQHYVSALRLEHHLRLLARLGFATISCSSVAARLAAGDLPSGKHVALTFDDGYESVYHVAMPLLKRHGFNACVFVVTQEIGGINRWDHDRGDAEERLMGAGHLEDWLAAGHEVGSHTRCHADLSALDDESAKEQIAGSREDLMALLGRAPDLFCYPYGRFAARTPEMVRECGYGAAFGTKSRGVRAGCDPYRLPRVNVRADTSAMILLYKLWRTRIRG